MNKFFKRNDASASTAAQKSNGVSTIVAVLLVILIAVAMCTSFVACAPTKVNLVFLAGNDAKEEIVKVSTNGYEDGATLMSALENEKNAKKVKADLDKTNPNYVMLNSIYGFEVDASYQFIAIYTDIAAFSDESFGTIEVAGKKYFSATKGVAELPLTAGATYVFVLTNWQEKPKASLETPDNFVKGMASINVSRNLSGARAVSFF